MKTDIQAFVETSHSSLRVNTLNEVVRRRGIGIVVGGRGAGRDRFLDWWWQVGASHKRVPEPSRVTPGDIVMINLVPPPGGSVPVSCVALSMIWAQLRTMELVADGGKLARPTGRTRRWYTDAQFLSLFYDNVLPLMQDLQPRVVVVGNAQYLDARALHWLLLLRTHTDQGHALLARHALVFSARLEPGGEESSKFAKLMNSHSETRLAWPQKVMLSPMALAEFAAIMANMIRRNLDGVFAPDVDATAVTTEFYQWTQGNWWYITELARALDEALGPVRSTGAPREITKAVLERLRTHWVQRITIDATEPAESSGEEQ